MYFAMVKCICAFYTCDMNHFKSHNHNTADGINFQSVRLCFLENEFDL